MAVEGVTRADPLLAYEPMEHRRIYVPYGFPVEIQTNCAELLEIAEESWASASAAVKPLFQLKMGVVPGQSNVCPPLPSPRGQGHLFSMVADSENFVVCDMREQFAFGWVTTAALAHPAYVRYCLVEAAVLTLLSARYATPLHAACVSTDGCGFLLAGNSGAGKSTLAYACARDGFLYTSDDCSYLLRDEWPLCVRGNNKQFRFRPSTQQMFPELAGFPLTPRMEGKPSVEIPVASLKGIQGLAETPVHGVVLLERCDMEGAVVTALETTKAMQQIEASLFPMPFVQALQQPSVERLSEMPFFTLRYRDLAPAIAALRSLAAEMKR